MKLNKLQHPAVSILFFILITIALGFGFGFTNSSYAKSLSDFNINVNLHNLSIGGSRYCRLGDLRGSFRDSCNRCRVKHGSLHCRCRRPDGSSKSTWLSRACSCSNIVNKNGVLRCYSHKNWRHRHHHRSNRECVSDAFGDQACGFGCVKTMNSVRCAQKPGQSCIANAFGEIACGYHCMKSTNKVICAKHRDQNCVINAFGDARCGRNCRIDNFNHILCD